MCVSSGILFVLGFHLSWGLSVRRKHFNTTLVRIGFSSSIGPRIVELSGPFYGDRSTYSFVLFSCPVTPLVRHLRAEGPMGWWFKIQEMTVQNLGDDSFDMDSWTVPTPNRLSGNHLLRMTRVILPLDIILDRSIASVFVHFPYKYHTPPFSFLYFLLKTYCQSASVVLVKDHSVQLLYPSSTPFFHSLTILVSTFFFTSLFFFHIYFLFS